MEWMLMPYRRYADFSGRSRRMEYWMFRLFEFSVLIAGAIVISVLAGGTGQVAGDTAGGVMGSIGMLALVVFVLGSFIPGLAVTVRRLHDTGKSGWMLLLSFIPIIGPILMLIFLFTDGDRSANEYGPDPKENGIDTEVFR